MVSEFDKLGDHFVWLTIPFSIIVSWVFHTMEMIGDFSENPFEGLHNDVPINQLSRVIEIDLREILDEKDIPEGIKPVTDYRILV
jgi:putative membrane protein